MERFHLKLLLTRIKGATSYEFLRNVDENVYGTFREAAVAAGLAHHSEEVEELMKEAVSILMPKRLRSFFVCYLMGEMPHDAKYLFDKFKCYMMDDLEGDDYSKEQKLLAIIENLIHLEGFDLQLYGLPKPDSCYTDIEIF